MLLIETLLLSVLFSSVHRQYHIKNIISDLNFMQNFFKYLNEYFDHIYVITIEPAVLRREKLAANLKGMDYEFFFGADKNNFPLENLKEKGIYDEAAAIRHHRYSIKMKHGEVACAWSHRMVLEDMLAKGYEKVLVFEDDVIPDTDTVHLIPDILNPFPMIANFCIGVGQRMITIIFLLNGNNFFIISYMDLVF
jgi:hypothetical protein